MPSNNYLWLATMALLATKDFQGFNVQTDQDGGQGSGLVSHVTGVAGMLNRGAMDASNDPGLFLGILCQIQRKTAQIQIVIAVLCQIEVQRPDARNPSLRAASRAPALTLVLCQMISPPTAILYTDRFIPAMTR